MYLLFGASIGMSGAVVVMALLSKWFVRKRGQAVGIALSGMYIGSIAVVPLVGLIAEQFGWRSTYLLAGSLILAIGIPLILLVIKDTPQEMGLFPDGENISRLAINVTTREVSPATSPKAQQAGLSTQLKRWPLWLIILSFSIVSMANAAITQHEFSFVTDIGIPSTIAASALGFTMGLGGIGGFISGYMADRISRRYVSGIFLLISIIGVVILMHASNITSLWLFVVVFGLASGVPGILLPLVISDIFGSAKLPVVFGFVNILFTIGFAAGPPLAGFIFDIAGSYSPVFFVAIIFYIVSLFAIYFTYGVKPGSWRHD
jgi:MFS family permease